MVCVQTSLAAPSAIGLITDDEMLEEPMFRRKQPVQSMTTAKPVVGKTRIAPGSTRPATSSTAIRRPLHSTTVQRARPLTKPSDPVRPTLTRPTASRAPPARNPSNLSNLLTSSRPAAARQANVTSRPTSRPATTAASRPTVDIKVAAVQLDEVKLDGMELDVEFDLGL